LPDEPWLSRKWLDVYLDLHGGSDPECDEGLARLEALPPTFVHNDFHPANVLAGNPVIDWAYCGIGPPALDSGVLGEDGVGDGAFPSELADEVGDNVWNAYCNGLGREGERDELRWASLRGPALRLPWLPRDRPSFAATAELLDRWRELASTM